MTAPLDTPVDQGALERALEIRDAMIQVARDRADSIHGATQSEMRQAQGEYLAAFVARQDALVEALSELVECAETFSVSGVYFDEPCMEAEVAALKKARAALSKSEGV